MKCAYAILCCDLVLTHFCVESFVPFCHFLGGEVGVEVPTYTNNRTWMSLEGELKSMELQPIPACLCAE